MGAQANPKLLSLKEAFEKRMQGKGPKFLHLKNAFVDTLEAGLWRPGDPLPTETEFAMVLGISGGTIQSFMRELTSDGVVHRRRGVGSTVAQFNEKQGDNWYLRFCKDDEADLQSVTPIYIKIDEVTDDGPWAQFLGRCYSYICIRRVMRIGEEFNVLAEFFLDGDKFRPLLDYAPEAIGNVHIRTILADRFRCPVNEIQESLYLSADEKIDPSIKDFLPDYDALLEVKNFSLNKKPLIYQKFYIPKNPFRLMIGRTNIQV